MATPKMHIEEIRRHKFSIGREDNPLTVDLHHAVKHLSAELYTKDVHFLMELIQNAEDNEYPPHVEPSLEFVVTDRDITGVGAPATLLIFNNEKGFSRNNIESLCSVGRSTKKGQRQGGYIGEKGIGFKSVFLVTQQPYIFSNGYRICFHENPPPDTKIGYIVPEWVEDQPSTEDLKEVYGLGVFPNTAIVLPLRPEKVEAVRQQLASIHPEIILFMSKIKRLSVRDEYKQRRVNTVCVSKEVSLSRVKDQQSELFTLHLSARERGECSYYMWRQKFPVKAENKVEERKEVDTWVITLAFPKDERTGPGIYAFLPTEMVTGLPFIIQADFLLVSSRESIKWDSRWNQGILACIPSAFCAAFDFLVKSSLSSRAHVFHKYLPVNVPSILELRSLWEAIKTKLKTQEIILCEGEVTYRRPLDARRILPAFREILQKASEEGVQNSKGLCSTGIFIVHASMDNSSSLNFLGVEYVTDDWYSICIRSESDWVVNLSEDLYVQLLCFLADNWTQRGVSAGLQHFPLFKYHSDGSLRSVRWTSLSEICHYNSFKIYFSSGAGVISWLTRWNKELGDAAAYKFMPSATQMAINSLEHYRRLSLQEWLKSYPKITRLSVSSFGEQLVKEVVASLNKEFVIRVAQFFHFSAKNDYLPETEMLELCSKLPVVNDSGYIVRDCKVKLVPRSMGRWASLMGNNPWTARDIVELSEAYLKPPSSVGRPRGYEENELKLFISDGLQATDIPRLRPVDAALPGFSSPVGEARVVLLLEWIQYLTVKCGLPLPMEFKRSIMEGKWLNTHLGYQSPTMSFLLDAAWSSAGLKLNDLSFINNSFYRKAMVCFKSALQQIGVVVDYGQGCDVVAKHLQMHTDTEAITRLYKYLQRFNWVPTDSSSVKIWIPAQTGHGGTWKDAYLCVVHDANHLFNGRLEILESYYSATLLPFFSNSLGVSLHPRIEDYCNLWLDWISSNHSVTNGECYLVWRNILTNWSRSPRSVERHLEKQGIKLPVYTNNGHIELITPNETIIPDDLLLKELFKGSGAKFAWHPRTSDPAIPLDALFSMYKSLGAQNISDAVQKNEVSVSSDIYLHGLQAGKGKGLFRKGLYRILLGYLACPSFKLTAPKRHRIVKALLECPPYEVTEPFEVVYSLTVMTEDGQAESIEATAPSFVRWEKDKKRILIQNLDPINEKSKFCLATEFAEAISKGLLSEHPDLVGGLSEMLQIGCILGFEDGAVTEMLLHKNLQLFEDDERFLQENF